MFTRIVVPLDGSDLALAALPYVLALTDAARGALTLLQAVPPLHVTWDYYVPYDATTEAEALAETGEALDALAARLHGAGRLVGTHATVGDPADEIIAYAERMGQDLIAMTTHGHGGIVHWAFGSVARKVLTTASVPTLIVRPREVPARPYEPAAIRSMLVPLDGSDRAAAILPVVRDLARALGAAVTLARAVIVPLPADVIVPGVLPPPRDLAEATSEARERVEQYLQQQCQNLATEGITVNSVMPDGPAAPALLDLLRDGAYDLVAMTTHGRTGITRWAFGSVAERLVEASHTPILLLRSAHPTP